MSTIVWSTTNGGAAISALVDHGGVSNGSSTTAQEFHLRHTYTNPITNAALYARLVTGTYSGAQSAADDIAEILSWGDQSDIDDFGGLMVNMDATGSYAAAWPDYTDPQPPYSHVVKTGQGDSELNAMPLLVQTGASAEGQIPNGGSPNVRFKIKFDIPNNEGVLGIRQVEQVLAYDYTS
tara:strand:- start:4025 stop:4564 length:540 start_codon:yes stop_codon:yes gene_type:complete